MGDMIVTILKIREKGAGESLGIHHTAREGAGKVMPRDRLQSNPLMTTEMLSAALPPSALWGTITETGNSFVHCKQKPSKLNRFPILQERREKHLAVC